MTVYEEVGHGGAASVPQGVTEAISVDMGCVGDGLRCTERQVSICAKDSGGPYSYEVVGRLIDAARREKADYAVDVYPTTALMWRPPCLPETTCATGLSAQASTPATAMSAAISTACGTP